MSCIYGYLCPDKGRRFIVFLYLAMTGIGYLVPQMALENSSRDKGWISLIMVAISPDDIFAQVLDTFYDGKRCEFTLSAITDKTV